MTTTTLSYFAYGSNLHPVRLGERIPSARLIGSGRLPRYRLAFHKIGQDRSGKCNLFKTGCKSDHVLGAIYTLDRAHKADLDRFEGNGMGYIDQQVEIFLQGATRRCFTYIAQDGYIDDALLPFHWYKQLVHEGARYLRFPPAYVNSIAKTCSRPDPHPERHEENRALIERLLAYPPGTHGPAQDAS